MQVTSVLRYGNGSAVHFDLPDGVLVAQCGCPTARALEEPGRAVTAALHEPLNYPPLADATTPGDRVCVAVDQGVPKASELVGAVVRSLVDAGVQADGITVLRTGEDAEAGRADPSRFLEPQVAERITLASHDPAKRAQMAYLASTRSGHPILLNRFLTDADVVLPIGCIRNGRGAWDHGIHSPIFPTFSDERTVARYRLPSALKRSGRPKKAVVREVDQVGWLLGVTLTVQVVPGPGGEVLHVLAGEVEAVKRRGCQLYRAAWGSTVPRRASLVVAGIEGGRASQTWDAVGDALAAASRLVEEGGAIALCCELAAEPGPAIRQLIQIESRPTALRQIQRWPHEDALAAAQLARAQDRARVYLLSRLDPSLVDELEIVPVAEPAEVARLARRHRSCILLANAPYAMVVMEGER